MNHAAATSANKDTYVNISKFSDLGLAEPIQRALTARNHTTPTPIQARAIPELLAGKDILGIAQTGTGDRKSTRLNSSH